MQLQAREKRFLIAGSIIVVLLLAYLLWPSSTTPQSSVELVPADQRGGITATPPPPAPPPVPVTTVAAVPTPPAAPATLPGGIPLGTSLTGVAATGAIFSMADGSQRFVPLGREIAPGVTLQAVRLREVLLAAGTTNYRLGFGGMPMLVGPPTPALVSVAPPVPQQPAPGSSTVNTTDRAGLTQRNLAQRP